MNILVVYPEEASKTAQELVKIIKKHKIPVTRAALGADWAGGVVLEAYLKSGVRFVVVLPPEGLSSPWVSYLAGFSRRGGTPFIVYGAVDDSPFEPPALFAHAVSIAGEAALHAFFEAEGEAWRQAADCEEARDALLARGIPWGAESFAACVREKNGEAVKLFLKGGLSPDTRDRAGVPLLSLAARVGDGETVTILLNAGAQVNAPSQDRGGSALIDCALGKYHDIAALLLKAGADTNLKSKDGQSALIISVGLADGPFVELLLRAGTNADEPDALGASARKYAVLFNKPEIVELFEKYAGTP
jgi:hypothetical protein